MSFSPKNSVSDSFSSPLLKVKSRTNWSSQEDNILKKLASNSEKYNWSKFSFILKTKSAKQCRERWKNYLDPNIDLSPLNTNEQKLIIKLQKEIGNKWSKMRKFLKNRTENQIKNFFYKFERNQNKKMKNFYESFSFSKSNENFLKNDIDDLKDVLGSESEYASSFYMVNN